MATEVLPGPIYLECIFALLVEDITPARMSYLRSFVTDVSINLTGSRAKLASVVWSDSFSICRSHSVDSKSVLSVFGCIFNGSDETVRQSSLNKMNVWIPFFGTR